jgi:hypothetical protein
MRSRQQLVFAAGLLGLCAIGVGVMAHGGTLMTPKPDRAALSGARAGIHAEHERLERVVPAGRKQENGRWSAYLQAVDSELAHGRVDSAVRVWHDAYGAALASRNWESMIAAGDAFLRIGEAAGTPRGARMNAREAYASGLIRARRSRSVDGALRSAEAFEALGDHAIAEQCLHIAAQLAAGDAQAQGRVRKGWERRAELQALVDF